MAKALACYIFFCNFAYAFKVSLLLIQNLYSYEKEFLFISVIIITCFCCL